MHLRGKALSNAVYNPINSRNIRLCDHYPIHQVQHLKQEQTVTALYIVPLELEGAKLPLYKVAV